MNRFTATLLLLPAIAAGVLLSAEAPEGDAVKKEKEKLVGAWKLVSLEIDGEKLPGEITKTMGAVFTATTVTTKSRGKDDTPGRYTLDPSKSPKHIDFTDPSEKGKDAVVPAIYSLEGDTLKVCSPGEYKKGGRAPRKRPTKFDASEGTGQMLMVFKRTKP
jgi:uncharacterized protein (TIGR03067 family)